MKKQTKHRFSVVYEEYLRYAKKNLKNQSFTSAKYKFDGKILPFFKDMYLEDITTQNIYDWEDYILSFNFSNNHNRNLYYVLSAFFEFCKKFYNFDKTILSNVGCFKKKYERKKFDFYNLDEFNQFIKHVDNIIYKQFFYLMFYTGTRPGEAMALTFNDIEKGYINITKTINSHNHREIGTPKTYSSIRKIAIDKVLEKDLRKLKDYYYEQYNYFNDDFFLFGGLKPLSPTSINRYKKEACKKANVRSITLHQFRHSHATLLLQKGMLINEVSKRLGHNNVSTTLDTYTHTDLAQEKRVIDTLNSIRSNFFTSAKYKFRSFIKRQ